MHFRQRHLLLEKFPVLLDVGTPLSRDRELVKYGVHRTDCLTIGAIDAVIRIDIKHFLIVGTMNAVHRTHLDARSIFDVDAGLGYYERHLVISIIIWWSRNPTPTRPFELAPEATVTNTILNFGPYFVK
jgi:hypothetical protein